MGGWFYPGSGDTADTRPPARSEVLPNNDAHQARDGKEEEEPRHDMLVRIGQRMSHYMDQCFNIPHTSFHYSCHLSSSDLSRLSGTRRSRRRVHAEHRRQGRDGRGWSKGHQRGRPGAGQPQAHVAQSLEGQGMDLSYGGTRYGLKPGQDADTGGQG